MKKFLVTMLTLLLTLGAFAGEESISSTPSVKFEEGNFFAITSRFNRNLLDNFTEKVLSFEGDELFIYFDTPGGSVIALSRMAQIMESSNIKFTCIVSFAASAGFMLFQHCDNRYLLSDGVLMSHNWSGSFNGEAPRILTIFNTIQALVDTLEARAIANMSVDAKEYAALINNNLWMTAKLATELAAIDSVITNVSCSKRLIKQRKPVVVRQYFLGMAMGGHTVYKSGCPLIQKTYRKVENSDDVYVETGTDLFTIEQNEYVTEQANWIYLGPKK